MRADHFFTDDPLGLGPPEVNNSIFRDLRTGSLDQYNDIEVAVTLARLIHDDLESFGTGSSGRLNDEDMREAVLALHAVLDRLGESKFDPPFQDYRTFRNYWLREGAEGGGTFRGVPGAGGYRARRELLSESFEPLHERLANLESRSLASTLAVPISPQGRTGWSRVDAEINELRRHFGIASTPQDYRGVGNDCVHVLEALSAQVYDRSVHLRSDEEEPPVQRTKQRIERFVEDSVPGADNEVLRRLARASIEMAQQVKHSETPTRREAGIASDTVIQLANLLRRIDDAE